MKKRTASFLWILAVMTCLTLILGARSEPLKAGPDPAPNLALSETKQSDPAQPPAAAAKPVSSQNKFSFGVDEVAKMHQNGVEADVILNYIESSNVPYHPSAEEIVRLHDLGVPPQVITALIRHGAQVQQQAAAAYALSQQKAAEEAKAAAATGTTYSAPVYAAPVYAAAPPVVTYNYTYPQYVYAGYPTYAYSGFYSYPRYGYSGSFYRGCYGYPYRNYYSCGRYGYFPHFGFSAAFGHSPRFRAGFRF